jgi:fluoroacetyl-CoA thioesterase
LEGVGHPALTQVHGVWVPAFAGTTLSSFSDHPMDARDVITIGMSAERRLVVPPERTVGHFVPGMPMVYATPMMILEMEMASADATNPFLESGWVTVGTEVDIRHLAATPVGATVRTTARVIAVERRVIRFEVEAFDDKRRIGEGRHARGLVNVEAFNKRLGAA